MTPAQPQDGGPANAKWEYCGATCRPSYVIETCNENGLRGWELCGLYQSEPPMDLSSAWPASVELLFKRKLTARARRAKE